MKIRLRVIAWALLGGVVAVGTVAGGWYLNDAYRAVVEVYRKSALCDTLHCDELARQAAQLEDLKLPILDKKK